MKLAVFAFAVTAALCPQPSAQDPAPRDDTPVWAPHRSTRVLYAGWAGGARERAFVDFLKQWFDKVGQLPLDKLTTETARDYDVVIADWCSQYGNDGYPSRENSLNSAPLQLPDSFTKPVIAVDYVSDQIRSQGKLDWL